MIYFRNTLNQEIYAYDGEQQASLHVDDNFIILSKSEVDKHLNPEKYISDEERSQLARERMPQLTPIEFDIKLNNAGLYDAVQESIKDSFELRIAYNRATFFSRTDPFIDQARIALNLTDEQVDEMWMN